MLLGEDERPDRLLHEQRPRRLLGNEPTVPVGAPSQVRDELDAVPGPQRRDGEHGQDRTLSCGFPLQAVRDSFEMALGDLGVDGVDARNADQLRDELPAKLWITPVGVMDGALEVADRLGEAAGHQVARR